MAEGWESSFLAWAFGLLAGALHCALPANRLRESCILYCNQLILLRKLFLAHLIFCLNDAFLCVGFPSLLCWDNREVNLLGRLTLLIFCFKPFHPFLFLESLGIISNTLGHCRSISRGWAQRATSLAVTHRLSFTALQRADQRLLFQRGDYIHPFCAITNYTKQKFKTKTQFSLSWVSCEN